MTVHKLTVFYDGACPLCVKEMRSLSGKDCAKQLKLVDINGESFNERYPAIDQVQAQRVLHALDENGHLLLGLDVTYKAWQLVGKGWCVAWLRWPIVKPIADIVYRGFARHRYKISYVLTGQARCANNTCQVEFQKTPDALKPTSRDSSSNNAS